MPSIFRLKPEQSLRGPVWLILALAVLISGCGLTQAQKRAISQVAVASKGLGEYAQTEFGYLRKVNMDLGVYYLAHNPEMWAGNPLATSRENKSKETLIQDATLANVSKRVGAAQSLARYGELLSSILGAGDKDMESATQAFAAKVSGLELLKLSDDQKGAITRLVQAAGMQWLEYQKADALLKILPELQTTVTDLCDLLINDFKKDGGGLMQTVSIRRDRLLSDIRDNLAPPSTFESRLMAFQYGRLALEVGERLNLMQGKAVGTLESLKAANAKMNEVLRDKKYSPQEFQALLEQLGALAQDAHTLALSE